MKIGLPALILSLAVSLAGCGGGDGSSDDGLQVVSFGDSLSDVGTYDVFGLPRIGPAAFGSNGRYTTGGPVWTEILASGYGGTLTPAASGGFGLPPLSVGGLGYAQGGALVDSPAPRTGSGALAKPISAQIDTYLFENGGFDDGQLVLLQGGGNDIVTAVLAAYAGTIPAGSVPLLVNTAAIALAAQVSRLSDAGAQRMVLLYVPDLGLTPLAVARPELAGPLSQISSLFNDTLQNELNFQNIPDNFLTIDTARWMRDVLSSFRNYGFRVGNTAVACDYSAIIEKALFLAITDPDSFVQANSTALLCAPDTLTEIGADQTYMFADALHPSSRLHQLFADFVAQQIDQNSDI